MKATARPTPAKLIDNPGTWLDFTDLVFIDPIGTGFSRSLVPEDQTKKLFYSTEPDIEYLSRVIYDWLVKNDRLRLAQVSRQAKAMEASAVRASPITCSRNSALR